MSGTNFYGAKCKNIRGIDVPLLGFGAYKIGDDSSKYKEELGTLQYGYDHYSIRMIDTAEMYGQGKSESFLSSFVKGKKREELFVVDKILPDNAKKGLYVNSCMNSLKRMGLDYFDLYLLHWRGDVDLQEMVNSMEDLVARGLIKRWGVSNFDVSDMEELFRCKNGDHCFANQCLYNLSARGAEVDLIPWCNEHDVLFMAYSPIGHNKVYKRIFMESADLHEMAKEMNVSIESILLRFVLRNDDVCAIFKTSSIEHLSANMNDVFIKLSKEQLEILDSIFPKPKHKVPLSKI